MFNVPMFNENGSLLPARPWEVKESVAWAVEGDLGKLAPRLLRCGRQLQRVKCHFASVIRPYSYT